MVIKIQHPANRKDFFVTTSISIPKIKDQITLQKENKNVQKHYRKKRTLKINSTTS